jgi:hypothetical protein
MMLNIVSIALVLQLHNFAGAAPAIVHNAEREVTRVYEAIGVHVEWDHAAAPRADGQTALQVILLPRESGDFRRTPDAVMAVAMWTPKGTPAVYVFYRRVEAEAARHSVSTAFVLACALAHELGHVLMPEHGHSQEGLMRACWNSDDFHRADQGQLRFLPQQVALIRLRIQNLEVGIWNAEVASQDFAIRSAHSRFQIPDSKF